MTRTMKRKILKGVLLVAIIAVYLNIGWALGTYYYYHISGQEPQTLVQKILSNPLMREAPVNSLLVNQLSMMLLWPLVIFLSLVVWLLYALSSIVSLVVSGIKWLFWLIFAGGIAKILGAG